jgi:uncharacterized protein (DUF1697 family)
MPRYAAFLRAINVGGRNVKMQDLRAIFESLGLSNVETMIASGNVIFDSPSRNAGNLERKIEEALENRLNYHHHTFLRTPAQLSEIVAHQPFDSADAESHYVYIGFLPEAPDAASRKKIIALSSTQDELYLHDREIHWLCRTKFSESKISGALLEKILGKPATLRNSTTVRKIALKCSKEPVI